MADGDLLVELIGVTKNYGGLRPFRVQRLELRAGESIALLGVDAAMAEVLVGLITAAQLPDEGEVNVFGRATRSITSVDDWVRELDRFGLISDRAVLVEQFTAQQNLALPLSLDIDDIPAALRNEVQHLASEVGLAEETMTRATSALAPADLLRLRLGRALAMRPRVLLAEHPNALLSAEESPRLAKDFSRISRNRGLASLVMTADAAFAAAIADIVLELQPATGAVKKRSGLWRWFS
jgi:predicted ABC-type transport system involved in lysophospholipase L1 biosynthesis ATPase subunit